MTIVYRFHRPRETSKIICESSFHWSWETTVFDCSSQPVPYSHPEACPRFQSPLSQRVASPYTSVHQSLYHRATASMSLSYTDPTDLLHSESTAGSTEESLYIHLDKYFLDFILITLQAASWKYMLQFTKLGASGPAQISSTQNHRRVNFLEGTQEQNGDRGTPDYGWSASLAQLSTLLRVLPGLECSKCTLHFKQTSC